MPPREPICPSCKRPYPYGDPRAIVSPPIPCFECVVANKERNDEKGGIQVKKNSTR